MADQAKGSAGALLLDFEEGGFNVPNVGAAKRPWNIPFNTNDLNASRALNQSATIRGDRNQAAPFSGNKDVSGTITLPVNFIHAGLFFRMAIGNPVTREIPATNIALGGTVNIDASGAAVFSTPQTGIGLGDRVEIETVAGLVVSGYVTIRTDDSNMTIKAVADGASNLASLPYTGAAVVFAANALNGAGETVSITSGVMTFSATQSTQAVGQQVIYGGTNRVYVSEWLSGTTANVVNAVGFTPANSGSVDLEIREAKPRWRHEFKVDPIASLISSTLARGFQDLSPEVWQAYTGCKVNTLGIAIGGDGELLLTLNVVGADEINGNDAYDAAPSPGRLQKPIDRFEQFDAIAEEGPDEAGLVAVEVLTNFNININNNLDTETFTIGGGGIRRALPEGIANVSGNISALFEDDSILAEAQANSTRALKAVFTSGTNVLEILLPEAKYQQNSPSISGPGGVTLDLEFQAFFSTDSNASCVVVALTNDQPAYS